MEGIRLTQDAMSSHLGEGGTDFVAAAISLFAFTSVVANYAYGESNLHMFKLDNQNRPFGLHYWLFRHDLLGCTSSATSGMGHGRHGARFDDGDQHHRYCMDDPNHCFYQQRLL